MGRSSVPPSASDWDKCVHHVGAWVGQKIAALQFIITKYLRSLVIFSLRYGRLVGAFGCQTKESIGGPFSEGRCCVRGLRKWVVAKLVYPLFSTNYGRGQCQNEESGRKDNLEGHHCTSS